MENMCGLICICLFQAASPVDMICRLVDDLQHKWDQGTPAEMLAEMDEAMAKCNLMLDSKQQDTARQLSVHITARLYAMRAKIHIFKREFLLADADSSMALTLDPYQSEVYSVFIFTVHFTYIAVTSLFQLQKSCNTVPESAPAASMLPCPLPRRRFQHFTPISHI